MALTDRWPPRGRSNNQQSQLFPTPPYQRGRPALGGGGVTGATARYPGGPGLPPIVTPPVSPPGGGLGWRLAQILSGLRPDWPPGAALGRGPAVPWWQRDMPMRIPPGEFTRIPPAGPPDSPFRIPPDITGGPRVQPGGGGRIPLDITPTGESTLPHLPPGIPTGTTPGGFIRLPPHIPARISPGEFSRLPPERPTSFGRRLQKKVSPRGWARG